MSASLPSVASSHCILVYMYMYLVQCVSDNVLNKFVTSPTPTVSLPVNAIRITVFWTSIVNMPVNTFYDISRY